MNRLLLNALEQTIWPYYDTPTFRAYILAEQAWETCSLLHMLCMRMPESKRLKSLYTRSLDRHTRRSTTYRQLLEKPLFA